LSANPQRSIETPVRTISKLSVAKRGNLLTISVRADGFLYKMVRSIVSALVKVGEGRLTVEQLRELVRGKKRTALVETAPAHGLFLWRVFY
jgi:tRNA pseudouridine38-40 synthase